MWAGILAGWALWCLAVCFGMFMAMLDEQTGEVHPKACFAWFINMMLIGAIVGYTFNLEIQVTATWPWTFPS